MMKGRKSKYHSRSSHQRPIEARVTAKKLHHHYSHHNSTPEPLCPSTHWIRVWKNYPTFGAIHSKYWKKYYWMEYLEDNGRTFATTTTSPQMALSKEFLKRRIFSAFVRRKGIETFCRSNCRDETEASWNHHDGLRKNTDSSETVYGCVHYHIYFSI